MRYPTDFNGVIAGAPEIIAGPLNSMFPAANDWDAASTDLWAFRAHGGKLIMWQGCRTTGSRRLAPSTTTTC